MFHTKFHKNLIINENKNWWGGGAGGTKPPFFLKDKIILENHGFLELFDDIRSSI